jgi:hypothetical protein
VRRRAAAALLLLPKELHQCLRLAAHLPANGNGLFQVLNLLWTAKWRCLATPVTGQAACICVVLFKMTVCTRMSCQPLSPDCTVCSDEEASTNGRQQSKRALIKDDMRQRREKRKGAQVHLLLRRRNLLHVERDELVALAPLRPRRGVPPVALRSRLRCCPPLPALQHQPAAPSGALFMRWLVHPTLHSGDARCCAGKRARAYDPTRGCLQLHMVCQHTRLQPGYVPSSFDTRQLAG